MASSVTRVPLRQQRWSWLLHVWSLHTAAFPVATAQTTKPRKLSRVSSSHSTCPLQESVCLYFEGSALLQSASFVNRTQVGLHQAGASVEDFNSPQIATDSKRGPVKWKGKHFLRRSNITCHTRVLAKQLYPGEPCPQNCPFWAEEVGPHKCQFQCVTSSECGNLDPDATVADHHGMYCRACIVPGCATCNRVGGGDFCFRCRNNFRYYKGRCLSPYRFGWYALFVVVFAVVVYLAVWYMQLRFRPITNHAGLEQGLRFRSRTRLHRPKEGDQPRSLWPLTTNLLREQVAGPGLNLFFHFQLIVLIWASLLAVGWLILSLVVSKDLLVLGSRLANTPQRLCTVTSWGYKTQHSLMWAKVCFMLFAYMGTFFGSLLHAILQNLRLARLEGKATMKDYGAVAVDLPMCRGDDKEAEGNLKKRLEDATGEEIIGISLCWHFRDKAEDVSTRNNKDTEDLQCARASFLTPFNGRRTTASSSAVDHPRMAPVTPPLCSRTSATSSGTSSRSSHTGQSAEKEASGGSEQTPDILGKVATLARWSTHINSLLGFTETEEENDDGGEFAHSASVVKTQRLIGGLTFTRRAFIVFRTEAARDKAVESSRYGLKLEDNDHFCRLKAVMYEPEAVVWTNFGTTKLESMARLTLGVLCIGLALCLWTLCFYLPYAFYVTSFSYARGEHPGTLSTCFFTMLVVAGNQIMYVACRAVSEAARFRCQDTTEMTYVTLYFLACIVNFGMDMAVTSYTTYFTMVGMNARTSSGRPLEQLSYLQIFESYPMQRALGHFFFWYAFPSCFLVPFVLEPFFSIWLPGHIMELLVRSHSATLGFLAERRLSFFSPMDLARYSDILLNATIAVMAFLFPGSYVLKMFSALFFSHLYIVLYDHYRVLRAVPGCNFSNDSSEKCVQVLTAVPTGVLAACLVLKSHSLPGGLRPPDAFIFQSVIVTFFAHVMVHWLLLFWFVPLVRRRHERAKLTYPEVARKVPCSWFSANPVHCLRSKYIHHDKPPCEFYVLGKEHLLQANPKIGLYFEDEPVHVSPRHMLKHQKTFYQSLFGMPSHDDAKSS